MCTYCTMGDHQFRYNPPWEVDPQRHPLVPQPINPNDILMPWKLDQLREYYELLKKVKELEDQVGCPCEPNKANYLLMFEERIAELERKTQPGEHR